MTSRSGAGIDGRVSEEESVVTATYALYGSHASYYTAKTR